MQVESTLFYASFTLKSHLDNAVKLSGSKAPRTSNSGICVKVVLQYKHFLAEPLNVINLVSVGTTIIPIGRVNY